MRTAATTATPVLTGYNLSICEPHGQRTALDYDVIFSCVDRPWARAVLNQLAYSDLIPVIEGGLAIEPFPDRRMRNATWRAHVITPGRPRLQCNGQIHGAQVPDRAGLLDNDTYIKTAGLKPPSRENASLLAPSVTASMLGQFVSLVIAPGSLGAPDPLPFSLSTHALEHMLVETLAGCGYEQATGRGDRRPTLTKQHPTADTARRRREANARTARVRMGRLSQNVVERTCGAIESPHDHNAKDDGQPDAATNPSSCNATNPDARQAHPKRAVSAGRRQCRVGQSNQAVGLTWHNPNPPVLVEGPEIGIQPMTGGS